MFHGMRKTTTAVLFMALLPFCAAAGPNSHEEFSRRLVAAAIERTQHAVRYVPEYVRIPYPGGDVPADTGVCTDLVDRVRDRAPYLRDSSAVRSRLAFPVVRGDDHRG